MNKKFKYVFLIFASGVIAFLLHPILSIVFKPVIDLWTGYLLAIGLFFLFFLGSFGIKRKSVGNSTDHLIVPFLFSLGSLLFVLTIAETYLRQTDQWPGNLYLMDKGDQVKIKKDYQFISSPEGILTANKEAWDSTVWVKEKGYFINEDGFRSEPFLIPAERDSQKTTVMLIGDSFTWGQTTDPIDSCYADLLRSKGYAIYNTGIGGADPAQYHAIANKYIPLLKPDVVIVMYAAFNDEMVYPREIIPNHALWYSSNIGLIEAYTSDLDGDCPAKRQALRSFEEAIEYHKLESSILSKSNSLFTQFCSLSSLGTVIWKSFSQKSDMELCNWEGEYYSEIYIDQIRDLAKQNGSHFRVFPIPNSETIVTTKNEFRENYNHILIDFDFAIPQLEYEDYFHGFDNHLNNKGHLKYAEFIEAYLIRKGFPPKTEKSSEFF